MFFLSRNYLCLFPADSHLIGLVLQHRWPNEIQSVLTWRKPTVPVQQRADDDEGLLLEYYIKWKARPHMANSFVSGRWLYRISYQRYLAFQRKLMPSLPVSEVVEPVCILFHFTIYF